MEVQAPLSDGLDASLRSVLGPVDDETVKHARIAMAATLRGQVARYLQQHPDSGARTLVDTALRAPREATGVVSRYWPTLDLADVDRSNRLACLERARGVIKKFVDTWGD